MVRRVFVFIHRWVGLLMAGFLLLASLTGSVLAFHSELERLINPQFYATPKPGAATLGLGDLAEKAQAALPQARVLLVGFAEADQAIVSVMPRLDPAAGQPFRLEFDQIYLDPWTGEELGRRMNGDISQGLTNLIPFILDLHWKLALGHNGMLIMGVVALLWTLDCFGGFYLTLPVALAGFWRRWRPSWLIKRKAGFYRLNFDLHRASGLWLWPMLFVFAWSGVSMNLTLPVYEPAMRAVLDYEAPMEKFKGLTPDPHDSPRLGWRAAEVRARELMDEEAAKNSFAIREPTALMYNPFLGSYQYYVRSSLDVIERGLARTTVMFDGDSGAIRMLDLPTGQHAGNTITMWLYALHLALVFGLPYRIFVGVLGLAIAMLTVTGVYIWGKKRRARRLQAQREKAAPEIQAVE